MKIYSACVTFLKGMISLYVPVAKIPLSKGK
jgi:hypothetical protein